LFTEEKLPAAQIYETDGYKIYEVLLRNKRRVCTRTCEVI